MIVDNDHAGASCVHCNLDFFFFYFSCYYHDLIYIWYFLLNLFSLAKPMEFLLHESIFFYIYILLLSI